MCSVGKVWGMVTAFFVTTSFLEHVIGGWWFLFFRATTLLCILADSCRQTRGGLLLGVFLVKPWGGDGFSA
jgi:hypothetical protein